MRSPAADGNRGAGSAFAELLLNHRVAAGLSQRRLAQRSGLSERAVRDLERGAVARPRQGSVHALAAGLELSGEDVSAFAAAATDTSTARRTATDWHPPADLVGRQAELRALADLLPRHGTASSP